MRITNIVDIEAQRLGQVVKAMQGQLVVAGGTVSGHIAAIRLDIVHCEAGN
jgi:L-fucose isomerase-like protein